VHANMIILYLMLELEFRS